MYLAADLPLRRPYTWLPRFPVGVSVEFCVEASGRLAPSIAIDRAWGVASCWRISQRHLIGTRWLFQNNLMWVGYKDCWLQNLNYNLTVFRGFSAFFSASLGCDTRWSRFLSEFEFRPCANKLFIRTVCWREAWAFRSDADFRPFGDGFFVREVMRLQIGCCFDDRVHFWNFGRIQ